ncbi:SusC/RagA family TonB-linked outer membrane protein [Solitalea koreensis]|uniref:TonB-linked outer membrane protein, SusC/RagA family n=1 Tax=Solitalea koreensis TaxID=543615 RepID=A0A521AVB4_9SPHI|nr:SusC/RagA family TonB-linked outer membrane protein [Solitalea koreensis]SMO38776.1 TonB-linked outer membrane protein, SusC/RagA family [Solitalea koreensis]
MKLKLLFRKSSRLISHKPQSRLGRLSSILIPVAALLSSANAYAQSSSEVNNKTVSDATNVPIVATGIFKKNARNFTGASTTVTAKELERFGNRNLITSLRNVDPSFNIIENNSLGSDPNRLPEVQIRGNASLPKVNDLQNNSGLNTPLIILDGFQSTLQKLLDMNANEVESLTILKDASATAIYGSRAANGVVVITTKEPVKGNLRVTYRGDVNVQAADLSSYSVFNAKDKLVLEQAMGLYTNNQSYYDYLLNEVNSGVNTNWLSKPLNNGVGQRHNLRLEGGDQTFRYSASVQMNDNKGVMKGSDRKFYNGTINLSYTYKKIKFSNNLMVADGFSANSSYGNFSDYVQMNPYWKAYDANGKVIKLLGNPGNSNYVGLWSTLPTNPLYNATLNVFDETKNTDIINNTSVEWPLLQDLMMRGRIGITKVKVQSDKFRPADHTAFAKYTDIDMFRKGDYRYGVGSKLSYEASLNLNYSKTFGNKHAIFAGMDYSMRESQSSDYSFLAEGFNNAKFDFISMAQQYGRDTPSGSEYLSRGMAAVGNVNYSYDDRYFVDGTLRMDGSSEFGANNRLEPFWSAGAGWNMHNEDFLKNSKVISQLTLRGSLGRTGSQNFSDNEALSAYRYYTNDRYNTSYGAYLTGVGNENLHSQQTMKYDMGMDAEFLNRRLKLTADYYIHNTNGLVSTVDLPSYRGFASYSENMGKIDNRGYELRATAFLVHNPAQDFTWSVSMAMMHNKNKIVQISQAIKDAQKSIENAAGATPSTLYKEGYSTNAIWAVPSLGIDPGTGKEYYMGKDGQPTNVWNSANLTAVGSTDPKVLGNLSTMVRYKDLTLNVAFGYRTGGQLYNQTLINKVENADYKYNVDTRVYDDRWITAGDNAEFKGMMVTDLTNKTSRFVQDESTINCQNINLQYDLHSKFLNQRVGVKAMSFSASMADAFYLSTVKQERGIVYPFSRQFSFSVTTTF